MARRWRLPCCLVAAGASLYRSRPLVASPAIEAPQDFVAFVARSTSRGAIYDAPRMKWNSRARAC